VLENRRLNGSLDQIELGFVEREATPAFLMNFSIHPHLSDILLSNNVQFIEIFSVKCSRKAVHDWVQKADLQPESGKNPDYVTVDETVIQLNDKQYWLYAAVNTETNKSPHASLELTTNAVIAQTFLAEIDEKHDISDAVFLVDGSHSLQAACHRAGYDFR